MVVNLVRKRLLLSKDVLEVDSILSGWHHADNTEARNQHIEKAIEDIEAILNVLRDHQNGNISHEDIADNIGRIIG